MNNKKRAKKIIEEILYITLATTSKRGVPWNSPVYTGFDKAYNFFWISAHTSRHSTNIRENNNIAIVIYDSRAPEGTGFGVYIEGKAYELIDRKEVAYGLQCVFGRIGHSPPPTQNCLNNSPLRVYKAVPKKYWVNVDKKYNGQYVDKREELNLFNKTLT